MLSTDNYNLKKWNEQFASDKKNSFDVDIRNLLVHESWKQFIESNDIKSSWEKINTHLTKSLNLTKGKCEIFPYPDLLFNALNTTPLNKVNVVILGQDPYPKLEQDIPQAMGLSFSVPQGLTIPSSLSNILKNLKKYKHINDTPTHGNLSSWANQGCLMINASLTVQEGHPNSHEKLWTQFTDHLIKFISDNTKNTVFVLWGKFALKKWEDGIIDDSKHHIISSSHPSGLSNTKSMYSNKFNNTFPAFNDFDHFGEINKYLIKTKKIEIKWEL